MYEAILMHSNREEKYTAKKCPIMLENVCVVVKPALDHNISK